MDRNEVIERAFGAIYWQEDPFEIGTGDLYRLAKSISSSVDTIAVHSLHRIHTWIWPRVAATDVGVSFVIGDVCFEVVEDNPTAGREQSKKGVVLSIGEDRWKLSWFNMEGDEPWVAVGVSNPSGYNGFEPAAYCILPKSDGRYRGGLNAAGDDVGKMFELFAALRQYMPEKLLAVKDGSVNDSFLDEAEDMLVIDGGLGGRAATHLHQKAEQHAASVVFEWAAPRLNYVTNFLREHDVVFGSACLEFSDGDRYVCAVETEDEGRKAIFDSQFPHQGPFDRYLTWIESDRNSALLAVHSFAIPEGEPLVDAIDLLKSGELQPTVSYDYRTGETTFAPGRHGTLHIAHIATSLNAANLLAEGFNPENEGLSHDFVRDMEELNLVPRSALRRSQ